MGFYFRLFMIQSLVEVGDIVKKFIPIIVTAIVIVCSIGCFVLYNFTEVFGKKVVPLKLSSVTINYTPGSGDVLDKDGKSIVKIEEIKVSDKQLKKLSKLFKGVKKKSGDTKNKELLGTIIVNKDYKIQIYEGVGYVLNGKDKTFVNVPNSLYNYVYDLIERHDSTLFKDLSFSKASIHGNGARIDINNEGNLKLIKDSIKCLGINIVDDFSTYNGGYKYILKLDDKTNLYLFENNVAYMYIEGTDSVGKYFIFKENLYEVVDKIYKVSIDGKNSKE